MMNGNSPSIPKGQISILAGASGAGKTTLLMQAISLASRGEIFLPEFTWEGEKGIAYVAADRPMQEVVSLAKRLGVNEEKVEFYGLVDDHALKAHLLTTPKALFQYVLSQLKKPFDLLILDPIGIFIDGNINNYHHVARSLIPLNQIAVQRGWTILATHHSRKARSDFSFTRPQDRISGSSALLGYSGTQMVLVPAAEEGGKVREDQLWVIPHTMPAMHVFLMRDENGHLMRVDPGVPEDEDAPSAVKSKVIPFKPKGKRF